MIRSAFRSLENPLQFEDEHVLNTLLGGPSFSGVRVSELSALGYSPVWRCVNLIAHDAAKLTLCVKRVTENGQLPARQHPAYRLLKRRPNDEAKAFDFIADMTCDFLLNGNAYAFIERDARGAPKQLIHLDEHRVTPTRERGPLLYRLTAEDGGQTMLRPFELLHVRGLSVDSLGGLSIVQVARESIGLGLSAHHYGSTFFKNDATPRLVLEHPAKMNPEEMELLKTDWKSAQQGLGNAHKTAVLQRGMKATRISVTPEEAQLIELRQFETKAVCQWFGIPPAVLGVEDSQSYNSLEMAQQAYLDQALDPWLRAWEAELEDKLLTRDQQSAESHVIEFDRRQLIRADIAARGTFYGLAVTHGIMTINEARQAEGLNPVQGGDEPMVPMNMTTLDDLGQADGESESGAGSASNSDSEAAERLARDTLRRLTRRIFGKAQRIVDRGQNLITWLDLRFDGEFTDLIENTIQPAASVLGHDLDPMALTQSLVDRISRAADSPASVFNAALNREMKGWLSWLNVE